MDEPLSNLDAELRHQMRNEIRKLHDELGTTTIYVTHDQIEAMTLADRIAILDKGVLQQHDEPLNAYHNPANDFVKSFLCEHIDDLVNTANSLFKNTSQQE
jgi:multiple sugar transport system ATP-binding protein